MFNFFKKNKKQKLEQEESPKVKSLHDYDLEELLQGKESYKLFYWNLKYKDGTYEGDRILPLQNWEDIENVLSIVVEKYENIEEGYVKLEIKDDEPSYANDEIASLEIQIKHGYMRPYLKYREEGSIYAEEEKGYTGESYFDENNNLIRSLEFDHDNFIPTMNLTKDTNIVKIIFKEFYETGDVSDETFWNR